MSKQLDIVIPTGWNEIMLGQFQEFLALDSSLTPRERELQVISIFCDIDEATLRQIPIGELTNIVKELTWCSVTPDTAVDEEVNIRRHVSRGKQRKKEVKHTILIDKVEYGLVPNLTELTVGEWVDLEALLKENEHNNNLHKVMAVLYRPIVKSSTNLLNGKRKYTIAEYDYNEMLERADVFKQHMPVDIAYTTSLFFSLIGTEYIKTFEDSLGRMENLLEMIS